MIGSWRPLMAYPPSLFLYPHPQPVLACCLAFASAAQQASTSDNAGPPQHLFASDLAERLQTPVSGSTNSTRSAASRSPAISAAIERTCSYPVIIRKVGARPYDFIPAK